MREFWSLPLTVTPEVLIPRPETELVVERCLALRDASPAAVADLGTGSGAIALALAVERPRWRIAATDSAADALQIARANAEQLGARNVEFFEGDWFGALPGRQFELIVSNPPYVAARDPALAALRYEPAVALTPGVTGLEALATIISQAPAHLLGGGWLVAHRRRKPSPFVAPHAVFSAARTATEAELRAAWQIARARQIVAATQPVKPSP